MNKVKTCTGLTSSGKHPPILPFMPGTPQKVFFVVLSYDKHEGFTSILSPFVFSVLLLLQLCYSLGVYLLHLDHFDIDTLLYVHIQVCMDVHMTCTYRCVCTNIFYFIFYFLYVLAFFLSLYCNGVMC